MLPSFIINTVLRNPSFTNKRHPHSSQTFPSLLQSELTTVGCSKGEDRSQGSSFNSKASTSFLALRTLQSLSLHNIWLLSSSSAYTTITKLFHP